MYFRKKNFQRAIKQLHQSKSNAYGNAWKKRGEVIGIIANIARKVDRLEHLLTNNNLTVDEPSLDTAIDLLVYCLKYQTFLADLDRSVANFMSFSQNKELEPPYSDGQKGFEYLLAKLDLRLLDTPGESAHEAAERLMRIFQKLESSFSGLSILSSPADRYSYVSKMTETSLALISSLALASPELYHNFVTTYCNQADV